MKKRPIIFLPLFVTLLLAFASAYSFFDTVREADLFSESKYEERDMEGVCAEKASNLDGALVSTNLFSPLPDAFFKFLPGFCSPDILLVTTFSVLRC
jgi:hypothetical protein